MRQLNRLKTKVFRRSTSPAGNQSVGSSASTDSTTALQQQQQQQQQQPRTEKFGLFSLTDGTVQESQASQGQIYPVDVIAIHGLSGDAYSTWRHDPDGTIWLRDLLPGSLPGCRVFSYGYPAKTFSESTASVQEVARNLLAQLRDMQGVQPQGKRPLIFICHSLGGIVAKQALVTAHEEDSRYGDVLKSVIGIVFLGTPHRGSNIADIASVAGNIVETFVATATAGWNSKVLRTDLLNDLIYDSRALQDLSTAARNRLAEMKVVSFIETKTTPPLSSLLVDKTSATLNLDNEEQIPVFEDHKSICRFSGRTQSYNLIANALRGIAFKVVQDRPAAERSSTHSSLIVFGFLERSCMALLNDHDVAKDTESPPNPISGTCQWIRSHHSFLSWVNESSNSLLWLTGNPGSGKTTMSWSLSKYFNQLSPRSLDVLVYLCQNKAKQTDANAVIIGLILQAVDRHRSMIRHIRQVFDQQGSSLVRSFPLLWKVFMGMVKDPRMNESYIIIDSLDECDEASCRKLLDSIFNLLADSPPNREGGTVVRFLITSRPFLHQSYINNKKPLQNWIAIDEGQAGYTEDIAVFLRERVDEISSTRQYPSDLRDFLYNKIASQADRTFLWIHIVLESIERSLLTSRKDLEDIITKIPESLATIYHRYLSETPSQHQDEVSYFLKLLLANSRPFTLEELNIAFTINDSHSAVADVMDDTHHAVAHTVQGLLGPLIRVSSPDESSTRFVSLVHLSLREFLLKQVTVSESSFPLMHTVNAQSSALQLATACIQYLLLDDFSVDMFESKEASTGFDFEMPSFFDDLPLGDDSANSCDADDDSVNSKVSIRDPEALIEELCLSIRTDHGFYDYASLNWSYHMACCADIAPKELCTAARCLLDYNEAACRNWMLYFRTRAVTPIKEGDVDQEPIVLASQFNLAFILDSLLKDCEPPRDVMNRALYWASRLGYERIVDSLLGSGADPNARFLEGQNALTTAAEFGHVGCVIRILADERTDPTTPGRDGRNALSLSCSSGHDEIVKQLLARSDCNANDPDSSGTTPLFRAVGGEHIAIMKTLLRQRGVDVNRQDKKGRTVFSYAASEGKVAIMQMLLKTRRIDVNMKDNKGKSPLLWAATEGQTSTVDLLLRNPQVVRSSVDHDKRSAISWACGNGHHETLVKLIEEGCPGVDTPDIDGWVPLAWAVYNDSPQTVHTIIKNPKVRLERTDRAGRTALHWAVDYGHVKVVRVLLLAGADPWAKSDQGNTPISIAEQPHRGYILAELLSHTV